MGWNQRLKKNQMNKNELKVKHFQYGDTLCDWVNGTCTITNLKRDLSKTITVVSITSANRYQGEGFNLFYYEH